MGEGSLNMGGKSGRDNAPSKSSKYRIPKKPDDSFLGDEKNGQNGDLIKQ